MIIRNAFSELADGIMKTEIRKEFRWGFLLSEQELRRIAQCCRESFAKCGVEQPKSTILIVLKDGSRLESDKLEQVFELENHGTKSVERLSLRYDDGSADPDFLVELNFQDGERNPKSWTSVDFRIISRLRDWAIVLAAEFEERIKRTKLAAFPYIFSHRITALVPLAIGFLLTMYFVTYFSQNSAFTAVELLDEMYRQEKINDPIEALIFFEKTKIESRYTRFSPLILLGALIFPISITLAVAFMARKIRPSYVFYWGDNVPYFDKRASILKVIWIALILGVPASIIGGLILKFL